jgi:hypothetical protein
LTSAAVLSRRALNRALLARQHLLARAAMPPRAMVEHLVGMQAQNPGDPYIGLWSRLEAFTPDEVSSAIADRQAVRMGLMRTTLHLVTAADAVATWPVVRDVLVRAWRSSPFQKDLAGVDLDAVLAEAAAFLRDEPHSIAALGTHLAAHWPDRPKGSLAYAARFLLPIVQAPPRGLWGRAGQPRWQRLDTWLGLDGWVADAAAPDELVLRYLAAFGPASAKDVATWSWLTGVREVLERLRPRLVTHRDENGAELFDVPGAPLPDPDTPAPARLLPEYDNVTLSHADRSRIVAPEAFGRLTGFVGTFLVDGFVAGQWRLDRSKGAATIVLDPFVELDDDQREGLVAQARALLAFAAPDAAPDVTFGVAREPAGGETPNGGRGIWARR